MAIEPFILKSVQRAQQWVDLCSKGMEIARDEAASMLANLCGFGSWDLMIFAMESLPPSRVDEDVDEKLANERTRNYAKILVSRCGLDPGEALYLLGALPPSSNRRYEAFQHGDAITLHSDQLRAFEDFAHDVAESDLGEETDEEIASEFWVPPDPEKVSVALQLCGFVEEEPWIAIFSELGWDFRAFSEYQTNLGEASFVIHDADLGEIPVYLTPTAPEPRNDPQNSEDRAQILQRQACVGDFITEWKVTSRVALLLSRWPWILKRDGRSYCHLGSVYDRELNSWHDLLFSRDCASVGVLLALNEQVTDLQLGSPALEDVDGEFSKFATLCLSGVGIADMLIGSKLDLVSALNVDTGWAMQRIILDEDEDEDDEE
ncbi:hypothetical protein [Pseudomonas violetae]|uniref:Uncharacterized protein n=1 Tax=Pseudomonas violetae TaxID=2915813 RepID=A0ABT0ESW2_9PSED|nr:hypothetical protein [Pseudomonas violetae]MCK1788825.1 hypothetical protein [Pseudomonas violetae]